MTQSNGDGRRHEPPRRPNRPGGGAKRRPGGPGGAGPRRPGPGGAKPGPIGLRQVDEGVFELVHPACVEETELDYQEGIELWKAGDPEEARDALRFALEGCSANLWIHVALGDLALKEFRDPRLARGHYGYAFEIAQRAFPPGFRGRLPRERHANSPFHDALQGLIASLRAVGEDRDADGLQKFLDSLR